MIGNKFLVLIFSLLILSKSLFAIEESKIKDVMQEKIDNVISILQQKDKTLKERTDKIFFIMDSLFDYNVMSQIALGKDWKNLSNEEKAEFTKLFETKLKNSYIDKLDLYTNQKIKIDSLDKLNPKRIRLITYLIGKDDKYEIEYKFYKNSNDDWLIYDVNIIGVSIMQTYRQQFAGYLKNKSFKDLLLTLNTKTTN
ncbi:toluene tolerance family protein [Arcobacter nitrofigilis DSM 7299]|uniref:Toluene tolerance family protein n=1 Tax=Arcobacter nitrofigilis (strain ATCC 33309 / DSM 7299 / CCUG 15893 / LMG 7604 / NCTC 12251 / CI) TaxID=572480 RepID=D5V6B6_ARCNC|nr:ABC transporter substrate-binding protein [Arcobacter nitrofigilis]ADG94186.1 toluene tolerance family protein [Arcobacter nitrofigilis DSM 7299]